MKRVQAVARRHRLVILFALFAVLGLAALLAARAADADSSLKVEAESGIVSGKAVIMDDPTASEGKFVTFGQSRRYAALGDSVASGDGIEYGWVWTPDGAGDGDWVRPPNAPANPVWEPTNDLRPEVQACRRSAKGYPQLVAAATGYTLYNPSCSGASVLNGVLGARAFNSGPVGAAQLGMAQPSAGLAPANPAYDTFQPDVVSVTLGMDDIGFSDFLRRCYIGTSCVTPANEQDINQRLAKFKTDLQLQLDEMESRGTAAGKLPWVVLTTYYDPFNPDSSKQCADTYLGLGNGLGANEIDWMRSKMQVMNQYIKDAGATYPKTKIADISQALAGHEFCSADPWVYGISIWYSDVGNPAPFHPTPQGQAAIAAVLSPIIKSL